MWNTDKWINTVKRRGKGKEVNWEWFIEPEVLYIYNKEHEKMRLHWHTNLNIL